MEKTEQLKRAFNELGFNAMVEYCRGIDITKTVGELKEELIITVGQDQSELADRGIDFQDLIDGIQTLAPIDFFCLRDWEEEVEEGEQTE